MAWGQRVRWLVPRQSNLPVLIGAPGAFARRYAIPLLVLLIAASADAATTLRNALVFGTDIELHAVQRWVFTTFGAVTGVPLAKFVQLVFVVFVAAWWRPWTTWVLLACAALYAAAAASNYWLLL
jgi:hypothetical protein